MTKVPCNRCIEKELIILFKKMDVGLEVEALSEDLDTLVDRKIFLYQPAVEEN